MRNDKALPKPRPDTESHHPVPLPPREYSGFKSTKGQDTGNLPLFYDPVAQLLQGRATTDAGPTTMVLRQQAAATSPSQRKRPHHRAMARNARISAVVADLRILQTMQQDDVPEHARNVP